MSASSGRWVNSCLFTVRSPSDSFPKSASSLRERTCFLPSRETLRRFSKLLSISDSRGLQAFSGAGAVSSSVVAIAFSLPPAQDPAGSVDSEESSQQLERIERVVIRTTRRSRTARVLSREPEYSSDRYVKGSLKYRIELSRSFRIGETVNEDETDGSHKHEELRQLSVGSEETSTSGGEERSWSSATYSRQAQRNRQRFKEVFVEFPPENPESEERPAKNEKIQANDPLRDGTELRTDPSSNDLLVIQEELSLRRALDSKRRIASDILETSIQARQLSPTYTKEVMSFMTPFIDRIVTEAVALKQSPSCKELSFNSRSRLYISKCKVVELIKWLKHQRLTAPRIGKLICIADDCLGRIKSRVSWLKTIYVTGRDLGVVIERQPRILELSLEDLNMSVDILQNSGVQRKWLGLVVSRSPKVLTLSSEELFEKIRLFTDLGLSEEQFGVMVFKFPAVLGHFSVDEMESKVKYLQQIGMDDAVLVKILASAPQLLACSIEPAWTKLLRYFYFLGIELAGVRRILGVNPSIFCLNVDENIAPKVKFLRAIGVHEESIGQMIVNFPAILTYSLDKKIRPVVKFLLEDAGVTEQSVGKVISMRPQLIRCSLPNKLQVLVKYFWSKRISPDKLGRMIEDFPALLMYSVPVLHPKFQYVTRVMKIPLADVVTFPRYFSYSLKSRIIPRHELLKEKGLTFGLRYMLACSDVEFNTRVAREEQLSCNLSNAENEAGFVKD